MAGWCVAETNDLLNNVWVCRVRGDSHHCGMMSAQQQLNCLFLVCSSCFSLLAAFAELHGVEHKLNLHEQDI